MSMSDDREDHCTTANFKCQMSVKRQVHDALTVKDLTQCQIIDAVGNMGLPMGVNSIRDGVVASPP
jgi:hypothetical protein